MGDSKIFVKHHLGMGDNIVHNGMVRKISQDNPNSVIYVAAKKHNFKNVEFMYRDNPRIKVIDVNDDNDMYTQISNGNFDKVISSHFADGNPYLYNQYFDDAFYKTVNMDPSIKITHFYVERDLEIENRVFDELVTNKGITDYVFVHDKSDSDISINKNRIEEDLPIIKADTKYGIFELLKVIENAKSVNIISSSFLSLMLCKKYNENIVAHMYCDRGYITPYIKQHNIKTLI